MKSLVTGGKGFIGSNLVDELVRQGHEVIVIDNECSSDGNFYFNDNAKFYDYDIRDEEATRPLYEGVDYVFHLAAEARIQPAIENPIQAVSINSVGTCTVLQLAREAGVKRVIYSSTSSGYGMNEPPNVECQPDDCLNPYSVSKVNGEKLCKMYTDLFGLETIIFRYFNVYGKRQPLKGQYAPVIGIFFRQLVDGQTLTIVGDGEQRRDFTHVTDIVDGLYRIAMSEEKHDDAWELGTGVNFSMNELYHMFKIKFGTECIYIPDQPGNYRKTLQENKDANQRLNWNPTDRLQTYINSL